LPILVTVLSRFVPVMSRRHRSHFAARQRGFSLPANWSRRDTMPSQPRRPARTIRPTRDSSRLPRSLFCGPPTGAHAGPKGWRSRIDRTECRRCLRAARCPARQSHPSRPAWVARRRDNPLEPTPHERGRHYGAHWRAAGVPPAEERGLEVPPPRSRSSGPRPVALGPFAMASTLTLRGAASASNHFVIGGRVRRLIMAR